MIQSRILIIRYGQLMQIVLPQIRQFSLSIVFQMICFCLFGKGTLLEVVIGVYFNINIVHKNQTTVFVLTSEILFC